MSDADTEKLETLIKNVTDIPGVKSSSKSEIYRRQWLTSVYFCLPLIIIGMAHGHSTILMLELQSLNTTNHTLIENGEIYGKPKIVVESMDTRSWIVSILMLGMCAGCWVLAFFSRLFSRKKMLMISMGLFFMAWIILVFAKNANQVLIGRGVIGFSAGIAAGIVPVFQGECAVPKLRAALNVMHSASVSLGVEITHALGIWFHWRTISLIAGLTSVLSLTLYFNMEDSPVWLLKNKKFLPAVKSWTYWRGTGDLDELKSMRCEKSKVYDENSCKKEGSDKFFTPTFWKPLGILMIFFTVTQLSGMGAVTHYCIQMIIDIAGSDRAYGATIILDTFRFVSSLTSTMFTKRYGPRAIALWSAVSSSFLLISLAVTIFLDLGNSWFALTLLFAYEAAVITGLVSLPWSFCSELLPTSHKDVGISISSCYNFSLFFLVLKLNPSLQVKFQPWGVFLFYGLCTFIGSAVLYIILPDTRNKSLKEIELMFSKDRKFEKILKPANLENYNVIK